MQKYKGNGRMSTLHEYGGQHLSCMGASGLVVWESQWVLSVGCMGESVHG